MGESLYQDVVDAGGLTAVLQAACPGCDIDLRDAPRAFGGFVVMASKGDRAVLVTSGCSTCGTNCGRCT
ncbi:hypothetical protein AB0E59_37525 [Lentzea sp. NPDC034063]|uniref:hypothetical protein n=1 Tax=unclassified Lentzea TaxID=2643253 RepID=UPI00340A84D9